MANSQNFDRIDSSAALNAKLHQGYDPGIEHKEQGNLYSAVQFEGHQTQETPVLEQFIDGFAGALRNIANNVSNIFGGNPFSAISNNELPQLQNVEAGQISAGGNNNTGPAGFGADADISVRPIGALGDSAAPLALQAAAANVAVGSAQVSLVSGGGDTNNNTTIINDGPNPPPIIPVIPNDPVITAPPVSGNEDTQVALNIGVTFDPLSTTSIVIGNVPNGVILSAGIHSQYG